MLLSIDGALEIRTRGGRMVGKDESTELWRHTFIANNIIEAWAGALV